MHHLYNLASVRPPRPPNTGPPYLPQVPGVPDASRLQLVQEQRDSLEGADPGSLRDPLGRADPVAQAGDCAGAQTHLHAGGARTHTHTRRKQSLKSNDSCPRQQRV